MISVGNHCTGTHFSRFDALIFSKNLSSCSYSNNIPLGWAAVNIFDAIKRIWFIIINILFFNISPSPQTARVPLGALVISNLKVVHVLFWLQKWVVISRSRVLMLEEL